LGVELERPGTLGAPLIGVPPATQPDPEFFKALSSEVSDKGFLVTSTEDLFTWARSGG
jgi:NADH-quinone oxidoreductase subunit B